MEITIKKYQLEDFLNILLLNDYEVKVRRHLDKDKVNIIIEKE